MTVVSRLVAHWKSQGINILHGNSEEALGEFEKLNNVQMPPDLREYFKVTDGMPPRARKVGCDREGFFFWPLKDLKAVPIVLENIGLQPVKNGEKSFVFADYFDWSWAYAIDLSGPQSGEHAIVHVGTLEPKTVARSFSEFLELYIKDAPDIYISK
jgi:SMI1 / KNR4 family (SUKH-1)